MKRTSAALSRGCSTTAPEITADGASAPIAWAPSGTYGAASMRPIPEGPADAANAADAIPVTDMTSNPSTDAIRGILQRHPVEPSLLLWAMLNPARPILPFPISTSPALDGYTSTTE